MPQWFTGPSLEGAFTYGPEVMDVCCATGRTPDPEQEMMLDYLFAVDPVTGRSLAFEFDLIAARQQIKTGFILFAELGWLYVTEQRLIVHSAHELDTTAEAFRDLADMIEDTPSLSKHLMPTRGERPGIRQGNGTWSIELASKQRVKYKARTRSGARGLSGDKVVLDEGFALEPSHMGSILPTLTARPDPQVIVASSAGKVDSHVLIEKRDRGRKPPGSPRTVYIEWGDLLAGKGCRSEQCSHHQSEVGCALDDESRWFQFMTALGGRVQLDTIRAMRQALPPLEFAREFMVWWDIDADAEHVPSAVDLDEWRDLTRADAKQPKSACIVLDVTPDRRSASIGVAGPGSKDGRTLIITKTKPGSAWVVPALEKIRAKRDIYEVALHPGSQAGILIPALIQADIEYELLTSTELGQACAAFQVAVSEGSIEHAGQPELNAAVGNAITRRTSSGEVELWDRRDSAIDISPLIAGSTAAYRWAKQGEYQTEDSIY